MKAPLTRWRWALGFLTTTQVVGAQVTAAEARDAPSGRTEEVVSESPAAIEGRVLVRGVPVPGVPVRIEGTDFETRTDEDGRFVLVGAPPGDLFLLVGGTVVATQLVQVTQAARAESVVVEGTFVTTDATIVTITAPRDAPSPASTTYLGAADLRAAPLRTAEDALRLVPGLSLVQHGSEGKGHQFFLRGFDAGHGADFEVTLEGMAMNEWSNVHGQGYVHLGVVIPEAIQSVEVVKGPFLLHQGAFAVAGSADYVLGIPKPHRGLRTAYTIGTTNRHRGVVSFTPADRDGRDFVAIEGVHDDGFGQEREVNRGALLGRVRLVDSPSKGEVSLLVGGSLGDFSLPGVVREEDFLAGGIGFYDTYGLAGRGSSGGGLAALAHEWRKGRHQIRSTLYAGARTVEFLENYTGYLYDETNGDFRRQEQRSFTIGARFTQSQGLVPRLDVVSGFGFQADLLNQAEHHTDAEGAALATTRDLEVVQGSAHALMGLVWQPIDPLRLAIGARGDVFAVDVVEASGAEEAGRGTDAVVSPRTTIEWRVADAWRLFSSYGRGFRPPEARAFVPFEPETVGISEELAEGGEPDITVSDTVELGVRSILGERVSSRLSGFATFIENESVFDHVSGLSLSLSATRRLGTEFVVTLRPLDYLSVVGDITYVDARFVGSGQRVPQAPHLTGGLRSVFTHTSGARAGLHFVALASRHLPHGSRGSALASLDITAGYGHAWFDVNLEIENLLGLRQREGEYHFASHFDRTEPSSRIPVLHYAAGSPLSARLTFGAVF